MKGRRSKRKNEGELMRLVGEGGPLVEILGLVAKTRTLQKVYGGNGSQSCPNWVAYFNLLVPQLSIG